MIGAAAPQRNQALANDVAGKDGNIQAVDPDNLTAPLVGFANINKNKLTLEATDIQRNDADGKVKVASPIKVGKFYYGFDDIIAVGDRTKIGLKLIFNDTKGSTEYNDLDSIALFNEVKKLVPALVAAKKTNEEADAKYDSLKTSLTALVVYADTSVTGVKKEAWELVLPKVKEALDAQIKKIEGDSTKQGEMKAAMITNNTTAGWQDFAEAIEILKEFAPIKDAKKKDDTIFATEFLAKYKAITGGDDKDKEQTEAIAAFKSILEKDYANKDVTAIETEIKDGVTLTNSFLTNDKKNKTAKDLAPRLKLRDEKLAERTTKPEQKRLAELLGYIEFEYDGKKAAEGDEFAKINKNIEDLEKYIKGDANSAENKLFKTLGNPDQEIIRGLRTQMVKKRDEMDKLRKETPGESSNMSPWLVLTIVALVLGLL
nr:10662_t:CDS:2 [Entrophospora candida]